MERVSCRAVQLTMSRGKEVEEEEWKRCRSKRGEEGGRHSEEMGSLVAGSRGKACLAW